jgi:hypothetical protein
MWAAAPTTAIVTFVLLCSLRPQFGADGRYYLLSSIAQVLAAIVALSATLPLAFAGLSDYLPSFEERIVASWHFRGFVIMFAGSIALALILLCFACAHELLLVTSAATAIGCLASLVPYFVWIADRTRPKNHFDDLQACADELVRRHEKETQTSRLAEPAGEVQEYLGLLVQTATVAAGRGASRYLGHALVDILLFWLKYDIRGVAWAVRKGEGAWGDSMVSNADSFLAVGHATELLSMTMAKECWHCALRPSADLLSSVAESLTLARGEDARIVAIRGLWRLGVVAQHIEANGAAARTVARHVAVDSAEITEALLPRTFPTQESHVREWFLSLYRIDPTPELAGFRALVTEEHAAFRRRLDEAGK